jgi:hypothetical protein
MMKLKCDFLKARIGDKVFSTRFGNGYISGRCTNLFCTFNGGVMSKYDFEGYRIKNNKVVGVVPELYWSEPEIIIPTPPKRMVERKIERWAAYDSVDGELVVFSNSEEQAICAVERRNDDTPQDRWQAVKTIITYEIEE